MRACSGPLGAGWVPLPWRACSRGTQRRGGDGFTLPEVLLAVAILALLAALVVPQVSRRVVGGQGAALAQSLSALGGAVTEFRTDVGRYPIRLSYLTTPPTNPAYDVCGALIPPSGVARWKGPYLRRTVDAGGIRSGTAVIADSLRLLIGGSASMLQVVATEVETGVADEVENAFDGDANPSQGAVRWTATGAGQGRLEFMLPIRGC